MRTTITARELQEGDEYNEFGSRWMATEVAYDLPGNKEGSTRTTWIAVWVGGDDPGQGWRRVASGGNEFRSLVVDRL